MHKKGQLTVFIIVAILIVAIAAAFFLLRNKFGSTNIPSEFQGVYGKFSSCLEDRVSTGILVLESQGGYIYLPEFEAGSDYSPFSSQLNFVGNPVPYWYYISANNIPKENVPSMSFMEDELNNFIESGIANCIPENLDDGYEITVGEAKSSVSIKQNEVQINIDMDFSMRRDETTSLVQSHKIILDSELGNLYKNAVNVYDAEQKEMFLENYSVDVLRLYAPVDGVELTCSPKLWSADKVFDDILEGVELNIQSLKSDGSSEDYFVVNSLQNEISNDVYVKFLNSRNWSNMLEVNPTDGPVMIANPVGNQEGLGVLGFCYVPYHFVYDLKYPVLVQVYSEKTNEVFQFPFAVVIDSNTPRRPLTGEASVYDGPQICENKNVEFNVRTLDGDLNSVDSEIYFECFQESCLVGETQNGEFNGLFPQCANGYIIAKSEGFRDTEVMLSTINSGSLDIILDKEYELEILLNLDSLRSSDEALISFVSNDGSFSSTVLYPSQNKVILSEGNYEISTFIYDNVSLTLGASTQQYCTEVPRDVVGFLGLTKKECFDVQVPEQLVSRALSGGGKINYYASDSELKSSTQIVINAESLPKPETLNQLQENYVLYESKNLGVLLR